MADVRWRFDSPQWDGGCGQVEFRHLSGSKDQMTAISESSGVGLTVREFASQNNIAPKAILLLDNCSALHTNDELSSEDGQIQVFFLPPNVTAAIQPMDQNVIQNIKLKYQQKLMLELMANDDDTKIQERLSKINMKDICFWIHEAWHNVEPKVIRQSRRNIGYINENKLIDIDDLPLAKLLNAVPNEPIIPHNIEERYSCKVLIEEDILKLVTEATVSDDMEPDESAEEQQSVESERADILLKNPGSFTVIEHFDKVIEWAEEGSQPIGDILFLRRLRERALMEIVNKNPVSL
ncbi:jerky protein homolog-like [Topomyia yanbarensis]|uniref:jerky protein homolog-like n=1 Tax=Topomyia yanbarensis TaxID=2498891 RepID=UPI00273AFD0A|nr:jerky protein homolog-like [Topomyia yanbarensis]